jgi:hypothetical protein
VKVCLALIVIWTAAVPAFAQTDSDTNGTGISHGFAVSDGDTVKFGRQRVRLFGIERSRESAALRRRPLVSRPAGDEGSRRRHAQGAGEAGAA